MNHTSCVNNRLKMNLEIRFSFEMLRLSWSILLSMLPPGVVMFSVRAWPLGAGVAAWVKDGASNIIHSSSSHAVRDVLLFFVSFWREYFHDCSFALSSSHVMWAALTRNQVMYCTSLALVSLLSPFLLGNCQLYKSKEATTPLEIWVVFWCQLSHPSPLLCQGSLCLPSPLAWGRQ